MRIVVFKEVLEKNVFFMEMEKLFIWVLADSLEKKERKQRCVVLRQFC